MKAKKTRRQNAIFLKPFSRRREDEWNGIFSNSVKYAGSFYPDSWERGWSFTSVAELWFKEHVTLKHFTVLTV